MTAIAAFTRGEGPDVVLVHGALGDYRQWRPIGDALQSSFRVTEVSRRYHWPNPMPAPDASYTYEGHRDDLLEFLAPFDRTVHLVGHSYGAGIALLTALAAPAKLRTLTVIEPAFGSLLDVGNDALAEELAIRSAMLERTQHLSGAGDHETAARVLIDWLQASEQGFASLPPAVQAGLLENAQSVGPTFAAPAPNVMCGGLRSLQLPALVLYGAHTRPFFRVIAERAAACLPKGTLDAVPGCGHMSIVEDPGAVASRLRAFLVQN